MRYIYLYVERAIVTLKHNSAAWVRNDHKMIFLVYILYTIGEWCYTPNFVCFKMSARKVH
jgi:hypothetical protein